jgi:hypothetical protein
MEYYDGILFLTTNRTGQLDEAIKSRVHSALLYQTLTLEQTLEIFRLNIKRLELIEQQRKAVLDPPKGYMYLQADKTGIVAFAEKHWKQHEFQELGRWNGRQIRNAFISAAALARNDPDHATGDGQIAVLTERHFQGIASTVTAFDKYMARARGALDSERAKIRSDRHDAFDSGEESGGPNARNRRPSRVFGARSFRNSVGAPSTPTANNRLYAPSPQPVQPPQYSYMAPQQVQVPMAPANPQPYGAYQYTVQVPNYATGNAGVPVQNGWAQSPPAQQVGMQGPLPSVLYPSSSQAQQQFPPMAQQPPPPVGDPTLSAKSNPAATSGMSANMSTASGQRGAQDNMGIGSLLNNGPL